MSNWNFYSPIFHNNILQLRSQPIEFPQWSSKAVQTLCDIYSPEGLQAFQDIQKYLNLTGTSFFFYLQLRTAMHTYGVPWNTPLSTHPFHTALTSPSGLVSTIFKPLSIDRLWKADLVPNSFNTNLANVAAILLLNDSSNLELCV